VAPNAAANLANTATVSGGGEINTSNDTVTDYITVGTSPDLTITKSHTGFTQGQTGSYTLTVNNLGNAGSSGAVTVADTLPAGLTYTSISAVGWDCTASVPFTVVSCTRGDALGGGASYAAITINITVAANAPASVSNTAIVSGGGDVNPNNNSATDVATVTQVADLIITKTHSGTITPGQTGLTYLLSVNNQGGGATSGAVTVTESAPGTLTGIVMSGAGRLPPTCRWPQAVR
jgi:uncharacterized repeat protein (TIGR01451 family)